MNCLTHTSLILTFLECWLYSLELHNDEGFVISFSREKKRSVSLFSLSSDMIDKNLIFYY